MVRGHKNPLCFGLALRLKRARKRSGLKRLPLAEKAGLAAATARDIEAGESLPTLATVARLAAALGVAASWLAYGLGDMNADADAASSDGLGRRLHTIRIEQGQTKAAIARLADISPNAVANIEKGAQTGVEVLEALAQALGVSPGWLAFGVGPQVLPSRRRGRPPAQPSPAPDRSP
jgi:transcriptional regulator with XRE-family HTH domain